MNWIVFLIGLIMTTLIAPLLTGFGWNWGKLTKNEQKHIKLSFVIIGIFFGLLGVLGMTLGANWDKIFRTINFSEIQNTTFLEEAILIDLYNTTVNKATMYKLMKEREDACDSLMLPKYNNPSPSYDKLFEKACGESKEENLFTAWASAKIIIKCDHFCSEDDLIKRGLLLHTKPAMMKINPRLYVQSGIGLTEKGIELVKDLLWLRKHPNVKPYRPY